MILGAWALGSMIMLFFSLVFLTPSLLGPLGVTVWFVVLFLCLGSIFTLILYTVKTYLRVHVANVSRMRYAWRQGLLLSGWITGVLALSSLNQLGWLDAILLALLLVIVEIYVRFRWP